MAKSRTDATAPPTAPAKGGIIRRNGGWLKPWQPGQSGNPGGVGGAYHEALRICAQASPEAARKQVELMGSDDESGVRAGPVDRA